VPLHTTNVQNSWVWLARSNSVVFPLRTAGFASDSRPQKSAKRRSLSAAVLSQSLEALSSCRLTVIYFRLWRIALIIHKPVQNTAKSALLHARLIYLLYIQERTIDVADHRRVSAFYLLRVDKLTYWQRRCCAYRMTVCVGFTHFRSKAVMYMPVQYRQPS